MAGFQASINGRFWVSTEAIHRSFSRDGVSLPLERDPGRSVLANDTLLDGCEDTPAVEIAEPLEVVLDAP